MKKSKISKPAALALALCAIAVPEARAMEMGAIVVYSHLSEPLDVSVLLGDESGHAATGVQARVASAEAYAAAGVHRPAWADQAVLVARMIDKGRMELKIRTLDPVEAPASSLIVEVTLGGEERPMAREYAVILDPTDQSKAMAIGGSTSSVSVGRVPNPSARTGSEESAAGGGVVVRSGQVLYSIAESKKPEGVSVERMMIGVLRANPGAFASGNINRLKTGAILRMPSSPELAALRQAEAVSEVNQQAGEFAKWRSVAVARVAPIDSKAAGATASGKIAQMGSTPSQADVLRLGKPASAVAKSDDNSDAIAKKREAEEAKSRVKDLESIKADLEKMLTIKDKQLAAAQEAKRSDSKAETGAEVKPESKSEAKPEAKLETKLETKPEAKPEMKPEPGIEANSEQKPDASPVAEATAAASAPVESKTVAAPEAKPKAAVAPKKPVAPEATMGEKAMEALDAYGLYFGGILAALMAGVAVAVRRNKGRSKMMSTTVTPEREFSGPADAKGADPSDLEEHINAADTYIAFEQPEKAAKELEAALALSPANTEALIRLARIASKRKDRSELGLIAGEIGDATFKAGPYWEEAEAMLSQFAKAEESKPPGGATAGATAPIDLTMDLERSLMELSAQEPREEQKLVDASKVSDFGRKEAAFDLPSFDLPRVEPASSGALHAKPLSDSGLDLGSLSFDMELPDDREGLSLHSGSESLSMDAPMDMKAPETDEESELGTMLELAKAYVEMGDKEGARELLVEIAQKGSAGQASQAQSMLADL